MLQVAVSVKADGNTGKMYDALLACVAKHNSTFCVHTLQQQGGDSSGHRRQLSQNTSVECRIKAGANHSCVRVSASLCNPSLWRHGSTKSVRHLLPRFCRRT